MESQYKENLEKLYNIGVKSVTTNDLFTSVGAPPWRSAMENTLTSNMQEHICGQVKHFNDSSLKYKLPYSLIRLGRVDYSPAIEMPPNMSLAMKLNLLSSLSLSSSSGIEYIVGFNTTARHSLPIAVNLLSNLILDEKLDLQRGKLIASPEGSSIGVTSHQLPFNVRNEEISQIMQNGIAQILFSPFVLILALGGMILLAFAGAEIVSDREVYFYN